MNEDNLGYPQMTEKKKRGLLSWLGFGDEEKNTPDVAEETLSEVEDTAPDLEEVDFYDQKENAIAIGSQCGANNQGNSGVAIGGEAGKHFQGEFSISIGNGTGIEIKVKIL